MDPLISVMIFLSAGLLASLLILYFIFPIESSRRDGVQLESIYRDRARLGPETFWN